MIISPRELGHGSKAIAEFEESFLISDENQLKAECIKIQRMSEYLELKKNGVPGMIREAYFWIDLIDQGWLQRSRVWLGEFYEIQNYLCDSYNPDLIRVVIKGGWGAGPPKSGYTLCNWTLPVWTKTTKRKYNLEISDD